MCCVTDTTAQPTAGRSGNRTTTSSGCTSCKRWPFRSPLAHWIRAHAITERRPVHGERLIAARKVHHTFSPKSNSRPPPTAQSARPVPPLLTLGEPTTDPHVRVVDRPIAMAGRELHGAVRQHDEQTGGGRRARLDEMTAANRHDGATRS
uniref:Uncharacterized protein n=1 Tax=Schizaphis graminum TaxID=13262 RepID=A0A2S2P5H5_SCHGA